MKALKGALVVMAAMLLGNASAALAQDSVSAKVPFAFVVNGTQLPAGSYVVEDGSEGAGALTINEAIEMLLTRPCRNNVT